MKILENYPVENSLQINSISKYYIEVENKDDFHKLHNFILKNNLPVLVVGECTNIVMPDFFDGIVVRPLFNNLNFNKNYVSVGCSVSWHEFVLKMIDRSIYGFENLSLIPGSVGAAPIQNIGAYGQDVSKLIKQVDCFNYEDGKYITLSNKECNFSYRNSILKNNNLIIYNIDFHTNNKKFFNLEYQSIDKYINANNLDVNNLSLKEISNIICDIRNLVLPDPKKVPNVGSFFKNSIVKKDEINTTYFKYDDLVLWQLDDQYVKVGSARLIELIKDDINTNSSVFIYKNHSLILITDSNASQADVLKFANTIKQKVFNTFNILLEVEPMVVAS